MTEVGTRQVTSQNPMVLGVTGAQGKGPNRYGEAHYLDVSLDESEIFVADTLNWRVQRLVRR